MKITEENINHGVEFIEIKSARYIGDYAIGVDALQEADRIKNSIRDFESELWVY